MTSARDDARGPDEGPGGRLRQERLERGLSNQQAAEQLNLDGVVIQAIEDNDFPALGAPVFARGHLRRYAALLGIPEGEVLAAYDRSRQPETPTLVPRSHFERLPERHAPRWPWVLGGLAVLLVVCGLIAFLGSGAWQWPWHKSEPRPGEIGGQQSGPDISPGITATPSTQGPVIDAPAAAGRPRAEATAAPPRTDTTAAAPATEAASAAAGATTGALRLDFRFAQDSWIEIFDGTGRAILYDLGAAGTTRTISALPPLSVTIGNAPAVALSVNGQAAALPKPEPGQTVVRVRVERSGVVR